LSKDILWDNENHSLPRAAYILFRAARLSRPFPSLIEHAAVYDMNEALIQWVAAATRE
jgi:hypothetical protein